MNRSRSYDLLGQICFLVLEFDPVIEFDRYLPLVVGPRVQRQALASVYFHGRSDRFSVVLFIARLVHVGIRVNPGDGRPLCLTLLFEDKGCQGYFDWDVVKD